MKTTHALAAVFVLGILFNLGLFLIQLDFFPSRAFAQTRVRYETVEVPEDLRNPGAVRVRNVINIRARQGWELVAMGPSMNAGNVDGLVAVFKKSQ